MIDWTQVDPHMSKAARQRLIANHLDITPHVDAICWTLGSRPSTVMGPDKPPGFAARKAAKMAQSRTALRLVKR